MNELQPMTAGSTYKLPLNMLVVDEVDAGKLNLTDEFDITNTYYEYLGEHDNYVAAFGGAMTFQICSVILLSTQKIHRHMPWPTALVVWTMSMRSIKNMENPGQK